MCGISGVITSKRPIEPILENMKFSMLHRGPDNQSHFLSKDLGLVHTRLSIIDLSTDANQPMSDISNRYTIVFNGEIFNYLELRNELIESGIMFKTNSDTEVLLNGYISEGLDFLKRVNGFYSFCIYDLDKELLTLSRDFYGKKPLYYYLSKEEFIFGSEMKTIINSMNEKPQVNFHSLSHYLWKGYYANGESAYENINSILPGESIQISLNLKLISKKNNSHQKKINISSVGPRREIKKIESVLKESISYRLISDVPISYLLSGGVDSSLICCLASEVSSEKIETHYLGFKDKPDSFQALASLTANHVSSIHKTHIMESLDFNKIISNTLDIFDEPFADYSSVPSYEIYKLIGADKKVVISGDGADEIFGGYKDAKLFYLRTIFPSFNLNSYKLLDIVYFLGGSKLKIIRYFAYLISLFFLSEELFSLTTNKGGWNNFYRKKYMTEEGYKLTGFNQIEKCESKDFISSGNNSFERYLNYDLKRLAYDFLVKIDRTSMANSLEVRSPFLDKSILKKLYPANIKDLIDLKTTKKELKKLLEIKGLKRIASEKKMGFTPPMELWILSAESKNILQEIINDNNSIISKLFKMESLKIMISSDKKIIKHRIRLWHLMLLYEWSKKSIAR